MGERMLKPGDVVEVRAPDEILGTLDREGAIDAMPFMPEMLQYVGQRFTVSRRVEKICDTVSGGAAKEPEDARHGSTRRPALRRLGSRRLPGRVPALLEGGVASSRRSRATSARLATEMLSPNSNSSCATQRLQCLAMTVLRSSRIDARQPRPCVRPSP